MTEQQISGTLDYQEPRRGMAGWKVALLIAGLAFVGIAVLAVGAVMVAQIHFSKRVGRSREMATRAQMANLVAALETFETDNHRYPTGAEGLGAMVHAPPGLPGWHQLLNDVPLDGWGHDFAYRFPGKLNAGSF